MESESNKWFRDKWNKLEKSKQIEEKWFGVFNDRIEDEILKKHLELDKKINNGRSKKSK